MSAKFDERVMLISLLLDAINEDTMKIVNQIDMISDCRKLVRSFTKKVDLDENKPIDILNSIIASQNAELEKRISAGNLTDTERSNFNAVIEFLESQMKSVMNVDGEKAVKEVKASYNALTKSHKHMQQVVYAVESVFFDKESE